MCHSCRHSFKTHQAPFLASQSASFPVSCTSSIHCAGGNHGWAIAVGVILGVLLLALIVAALFLVRRRQRRKQASPPTELQTMSTLQVDLAWISVAASRARFRHAMRQVCEVLHAAHVMLKAVVDRSAEHASAAVQFQANSKANHLGTYPGDASHANPNGAAAAASVGAGAGAGAGLAGRMPSFKNKVF